MTSEATSKTTTIASAETNLNCVELSTLELRVTTCLLLFWVHHDALEAHEYEFA